LDSFIIEKIGLKIEVIKRKLIFAPSLEIFLREEDKRRLKGEHLCLKKKFLRKNNGRKSDAKI